MSDDSAGEPTRVSTGFEAELATLRERLVRMGMRVARQLALVMTALAERDDDLARDVIKNDEQMDRDENDIDELALLILATRQPVAADLRLVAMVFKSVVDLERIGDLATRIARRVLELNRLPRREPRADLGLLALRVQVSLLAVLDAFARNDAKTARAVVAADADIDPLTAHAFVALTAHVATDPSTIKSILPLTLVCRYLERIGDHVKNLAQGVIHYGSPHEPLTA